jgi:hypothetical protein
MREGRGGVSDALPIRVLERETALQAERIPARVEDFLGLLGDASMITVKGRDTSRTRIVATLLHGNEPSGARAVRTWLATGQVPAVNAVIFVAAVRTALVPPGFANRFLPDRSDLNRCWLPPFDGRAGVFAHEVLRLLRESNAESLVDLHNNSGHNPPYGVSPSSPSDSCTALCSSGRWWRPPATTSPAYRSSAAARATPWPTRRLSPVSSATWPRSAWSPAG